MKRAVYKYRLSYVPLDVPIPENARILKFAIQDSQPMIWCEVELGAPLLLRHFYTLGTGQPIPRDTVWVDTCLDGKFVWHLYEVINHNEC